MMRQKLTKILAIVLILLGTTQQGKASGVPLEDLGIFQDPETKEYVFQHVDHYPTEEEMALAEGLYTSTRRQLRRYGISGLEDKSDIRSAIISTFGAAARYGHPEALKWLSDSLSTDWSGQKKYEREAARAVHRSPARNLWDMAKRYQRRGKLLPEGDTEIIRTMDGVKIPKKIIEDKERAEKERAEAASGMARAASPSAILLEEESKEEEAKSEGVPLLRRRAVTAESKIEEGSILG